MSRLVPPLSERDHVRGGRDAVVELVEYGDYQCPYCADAYPIVRNLEAAFGPQLRFGFRNFPITRAHPRALPAALVAEFAGIRGRFWEMHDLLYEHHDALEDGDLVGYLQALGLDPAELDAHVIAARDRVREDVRSGARSGVNGTPTFFVNGERFDGPWWDERAFAAELRQAARTLAPA